MRFLLPTLFALLATPAGTVFAQNNNQFPVTDSVFNGAWTFSHYGNGIIKGSFYAPLAARQQQVSNAVPGNPVNSSSSTTLSLQNNEAHFGFDAQELVMTGYFDSAGHRGIRFILENNEFLTGTGERSVPLNRRGFKLALYNNPRYGYGPGADNLNYSLPFVLSSKGYGIFFDNPSRGYIDLGKTNRQILEFGASSGKVEFYLVPGKNAHEIIKKYHGLTGTQPIPARWVFGNLMSRFGYRSRQQVEETVAAMRRENIPVDAVILDLFWFGDSIKGTMGNLAWTNKQKWPNPKGMIKSLQQQHIKTVLITEPFVLQSTPNYAASKKFHATDSLGNPFLLTDFYFGNGGLLDIFRNKTQDWFWKKYQQQIKLGVAGWWGDLGEPEKHPSGIYHNLTEMGFSGRFTADEVHNIYGHYWDKMLYEKYARHYPETRLFNLNRSGYAGSPRYGVFPWSGDVSRSWGGLQAQLPLMLGMSMSGVPYIHADAGGFAGGEGDPELYTRWMQFAVFTPVLRPHGTALGGLEPSVKNIPSEAAFWHEPYRSIVRRYIQLRYKMLPYNYTLAYEQATQGKALVHPLFYYSFNDTTALHVQNEYMWGDAVLVAPVLQSGLSTQQLYLPAGNWYRYADGSRLQGGKWITEELTLNDIPLYIKAGSFMPSFETTATVTGTWQYTADSIYITYYPNDTASAYTLFDDDGHSKTSLQKGRFELIGFSGLQSGNTASIRIANAGKQVLKTRTLLLKLPPGMKITAAKLNGNNVTISNNSVALSYSGQPVQLVISW